MGDPAGVGPEIIVKALSDPQIRAAIQPLVFGDQALLSQTASRLGLSSEFEVRQVGALDPSGLTPGAFSEASGRASMAYLAAAADSLEAGEAEALVTGPIHKKALWLCGQKGPGQTEWLEQRFRAPRVVMMLCGPRLKVVLATTHLALREVPRALTRESLSATVKLAESELCRYFYPRGPRLALAALNPHGEDGGLPGREEQEVLGPVVCELRAQGLSVEGPVAGDTVVALAVQGRFDAVVALYHDQGLAPLKALSFAEGVNVTLGLPIIRTSPDHGVAYDIAGQGVADPTSLKQAILMAVGMAGTREGA